MHPKLDHQNPTPQEQAISFKHLDCGINQTETQSNTKNQRLRKTKWREYESEGNKRNLGELDGGGGGDDGVANELGDEGEQAITRGEGLVGERSEKAAQVDAQYLQLHLHHLLRLPLLLLRWISPSSPSLLLLLWLIILLLISKEGGLGQQARNPNRFFLYFEPGDTFLSLENLFIFNKLGLYFAGNFLTLKFILHRWLIILSITTLILFLFRVYFAVLKLYKKCKMWRSQIFSILMFWNLVK